MSEPISTKPYLIRAMHEWCTDNGYTPYIVVKVQGRVRVPMEFVRNGEIVLDISYVATHALKIDNQVITFKARFGEVSRDIYIPVEAVAAIYASENHQGMAFEVAVESEPTAAEPTPTAEKPAVSLAVTNTETSAEQDKEKPSTPDDPNPKGGRKKPSFTVIK